jgi:hypothetical protein
LTFADTQALWEAIRHEANALARGSIAIDFAAVLREEVGLALR